MVDLLVVVVTCPNTWCDESGPPVGVADETLKSRQKLGCVSHCGATYEYYAWLEC